MNIENEWKLLKKELTPEQQQDGERCFYCGVLAAVAIGVELGPLPLLDVEKQIREKLGIHPEVMS